jgi:hypothetical protein
MQDTLFKNHALAVGETFFDDIGARWSAPLSGIGFVAWNSFGATAVRLTSFRFGVTIQPMPNDRNIFGS